MPSFWNMPDIEPKRKFRFTVQFAGSSRQGFIPEYAVKTATKPGYEFGEYEHSFFGYKFFFPGSVKWNEVTIKLVDPVAKESGVSMTLMSYLNDSGWVSPTTLGTQLSGNGDKRDTPSKSEAVGGTGTITIRQYGTLDTPVEKWSLHNAWIKKVELGDLDYSDEGAVEVSLTIRYDWATLQDKDSTTSVPN